MVQQNNNLKTLSVFQENKKITEFTNEKKTKNYVRNKL